MMYGTSDTMQMARETSGIEFFWVYSTGDRGGWMIKEAIAWMRTSGNANLVLLLCIIYIYSYIIKSKTARAAYLLFFFFFYSFLVNVIRENSFFLFFLVICFDVQESEACRDIKLRTFMCLYACVCVYLCVFM